MMAPGDYGNGPTKAELCDALRDTHDEVLRLQAELAEKHWLEEALRRRTWEMGERVKELECLHGLAALLRVPKAKFEDLLPGVVMALRRAHQWPDSTSVRVRWGSTCHASPGFREAVKHEVSELLGPDGIPCRIEVHVEPPLGGPDRAVFLPEERRLLRTVGAWLEGCARRMGPS